MACVRVKDGIICFDNSYSRGIENAQRKMKAGIRQGYCIECSLWVWDDEPCGHDGPKFYTMKALEREMKRLMDVSRITNQRAGE